MIELSEKLIASILPVLAAAASRTRGRAEEPELVSPELRKEETSLVLAWICSVLLSSAPTTRTNAATQRRWAQHVAATRKAALDGDTEEVERACELWGGAHLGLLAALGDEVPQAVVSRWAQVGRHYRPGEQFASALVSFRQQPVSPPSDTQRNHAWLQSGLLYRQARDATEDWFESTTPEVADTQERLVALLAGFIDGIELDTFEKLDPADCDQVGRDAARDAVASLRWSSIVGDRLDTTATTQLLGVSRQALAQRIAAGTIHGLPGRGTTYYPTWQFDVGARRVRDETALILSQFRSALGSEVDPFIIASWMASPQGELEDETPIAWVAGGGDPERLVRAARHSAARAAA